MGLPLLNFGFHVAKLIKKLVKRKRFGKINAIQPEIKAKRGRGGYNAGICKLGGLVKELGCQIVTSTGHLLHLCDETVEARQQLLVGTALN